MLVRRFVDDGDENVGAKYWNEYFGRMGGGNVGAKMLERIFWDDGGEEIGAKMWERKMALIHISDPTRRYDISDAVFCARTKTTTVSE